MTAPSGIHPVKVRIAVDAGHPARFRILPVVVRLAVCGAFVVCVLGEPDGDAGVPQGIRVQFTGQVPAVRVDAGRIALLRDDFGKRQRIGSALRPAEAVCTALPLRSGVLDVIEDRKLQVGAGEAFEDGFRLFLASSSLIAWE